MEATPFSGGTTGAARVADCASAAASIIPAFSEGGVLLPCGATAGEAALILSVARSERIAQKSGSRVGPGAGSRYISPSVKRQEIEESRSICRACKNLVESAPGSPLSREFDHAWPYSRGGDETLDNIQVLCRTCNRPEGDKNTQEYVDWLVRRRG